MEKEKLKQSPVEAGRAALKDLKEISANASSFSARLLGTLIKDNENTEYGKKFGFATIRIC